MDDLNTIISSVLNDPDKMRQVQEMAASLGLGSGVKSPEPPPPPQINNQDLSALANMLSGALGQNQTAQPEARQQAAAPDLSALMGLLGNASNQNINLPVPQQAIQPAAAPDLSALAGMLGGVLGQNGIQQPTQPAAAPDLSALAGMLGNIMGQSGETQPQPNPGGSGFNVSALTNMLGGAQPSAGAPAPGIDMNMILKLGQAMSSLQTNRQNMDLLLALKPRLNEKRSKKVDDAIKVMQLIQFLPLLKDSGIFNGLDDLLGSFTGSGGLGSLLGNIGAGSGGLGSLLGSLGGGSGGLSGILNGILGNR